jgi:hypothetical protein
MRQRNRDHSERAREREGGGERRTDSETNRDTQRHTETHRDTQRRTETHRDIPPDTRAALYPKYVVPNPVR